MTVVAHWIANRVVTGGSQRRAPLADPATGASTGEVALAGAAEVDEAVAAARAALPAWAGASLARRQQVLFASRQAIMARRDELAAVITAENGKSLADARGEVQRGLEVVEHACALPELLKGRFSENVSSGVDTYTIRQPLGVVAGVTPFNFPAMVPLWMFPMALACGNTFVLKPSERDPSAALLLAETLASAGLPEGVLNVVQGDREAVDRLLDHPGVAAVSFVGSTPVARHIYARGAAAGKRVQALGGAKNHMVVLPDADLDVAADALVSAAYGSAGQRCMAISAAVAVGGVGDALAERIADRARSLVVGDGAAPGTDMGPLITRAHRDRVAGLVDRGVDEGAKLVIDGRALAGERDGFFIGPCMFDHVGTDMSIYREEVFGPVLVQLRVDTLGDAIRMVNANPYGNGTAIFTRSGAAARAFQNQIHVGMVGVNVPIPVPVSYHSFGGWGQSLFGDSHVYGEDAVRFYTRQKVVTARWVDDDVASGDGLQMGFPTVA